MKQLLYIFICFIFCSCHWTSSPDDIINEADDYNSYTEYDTLYLQITIDKLPYETDIVKIYSDNYHYNNSPIKTYNDKVTIYKSGCLYIEILNYWKINSIDWVNMDMAKVIELTHTPIKREYWCGDDIYLEKVNIVLIKPIRKITV